MPGAGVGAVQRARTRCGRGQSSRGIRRFLRRLAPGEPVGSPAVDDPAAGRVPRALVKLTGHRRRGAAPQAPAAPACPGRRAAAGAGRRGGGAASDRPALVGPLPVCRLVWVRWSGTLLTEGSWDADVLLRQHVECVSAVPARSLPSRCRQEPRDLPTGPGMKGRPWRTDPPRRCRPSSSPPPPRGRASQHGRRRRQHPHR